MIQKITYTSILPYAKLPKEFKGSDVVGHYTGYNLKKGVNLLEASVAEKIYRERIDDIVRGALNLHGKVPNSSSIDILVGCKCCINTYFLEESDGTSTGSIISYLATKHLSDLRVRERYLRKGSDMPEGSNDMIAGVLQVQVLTSSNDPDIIKNLYDTLKSLQSKGDGIVRVDPENLFISPAFFDMNEVKSVVEKYLMFDNEK